MGTTHKRRIQQSTIAPLLAVILAVGLLLSSCSALSPQYPASGQEGAPTPADPLTVDATTTPPPDDVSSLPTDSPPSPQAQQFPSPIGGWIAYVDTQADSLILGDADGHFYAVFEPGDTIGMVEWSPTGQALLVVRHEWPHADDHAAPATEHLLQLWQVRVQEHGIEPTQQLFEVQFAQDDAAYLAADLQFGTWSPNGRYVPFWFGPRGNSVRNDGLPLWIADLEQGTSTRLAASALLTPHYQSWAPDSSALAYVAGGNRSAQVNKWLNLYDVAAAQVTTLISDTEQVPGIVAWSPAGNWIAYAAVTAAATGPEWAGLMTFDNPAINGRRIYLLDPSTGAYARLNDVEAFQDGPLWHEEGQTLYYVQRHDDTLALMVADVETGVGEVVAGTHRSLPEIVGYYGQGNWEEYWHDVTRATATPVATDGEYTGIAALDHVITAILMRDKQAIRAAMHFIQLPCTTASGKGGPPKCAEHETAGTLVEVFPILSH